MMCLQCVVLVSQCRGLSLFFHAKARRFTPKDAHSGFCQGFHSGVHGVPQSFYTLCGAFHVQFVHDFAVAVGDGHEYTGANHSHLPSHCWLPAWHVARQSFVQKHFAICDPDNSIHGAMMKRPTLPIRTVCTESPVEHQSNH